MNFNPTPARVRESSKMRIALTNECHAYLTRYNADGSIKVLSLYFPTQSSWERLVRAQETLDYPAVGISKDEDRPF